MSSSRVCKLIKNAMDDYKALSAALLRELQELSDASWERSLRMSTDYTLADYLRRCEIEKSIHESVECYRSEILQVRRLVAEFYELTDGHPSDDIPF